jgi:ferredoxin
MGYLSSSPGILITFPREKSGRFAVPEGKTLLEGGVDVMYSCQEGVCGACETVVISGTPDHRDNILTEAERVASKTMMVCCSGSKSPRLVLDL